MTEGQREIGIRMALGANRSSVLSMVVGQGLAMTAVGVVLGIGGALVLDTPRDLAPVRGEAPIR